MQNNYRHWLSSKKTPRPLVSFKATHSALIMGPCPSLIKLLTMALVLYGAKSLQNPGLWCHPTLAKCYASFEPLGHNYRHLCFSSKSHFHWYETCDLISHLGPLDWSAKSAPACFPPPGKERGMVLPSWFTGKGRNCLSNTTREHVASNPSPRIWFKLIPCTTFCFKRKQE